MALAGSQRILTNPFQDYKAIPLEPQKPLSPPELVTGLGLAGLSLACFSKATFFFFFTPKTKTKQDPSQEPWACCPPLSIMKEGEASSCCANRGECFVPSHRSGSHSLSLAAVGAMFASWGQGSGLEQT